jgi:hypothetical protein
MNNRERKSNAYLSKSLFVRGLQCHKSLYLKKYQPELAEAPSEDRQAIMESGQDVGILARELFPGGVEIPYEGLSYEDQIQKTAAAIKADRTVYEGAFSHDNIFIKVDILRKGQTGWELHEVKASTDVKPYHENDLAVQYYVLKNAGIPVSKAYLTHINNQYVRNGEIEVDKLFTPEDLTALVQEKEGFVQEEIAKMRTMLKGKAPAIDIGAYCGDPFECDFKSYCWQHIQEGSVFELAGNGKNPFDLYYQGIVNLTDIPLDLLPSGQRVQVECAINKNTIVNREKVKEFLDSLWYPLYYLDFETFIQAIPPYDGTRPYQQTPFQYSLYSMAHAGDQLEHKEFLAEPNMDPRREIAHRLAEQIPKEACVIAYNASFEAQRLGELAESFPEYQERLWAILDNLRDLAAPFRSKHVYLWGMGGSWSQKAVLPALVPELSYDGMEVADGGMAMDAYARMCASKDPGEVERIRKALLEYCKLDTLGMVKILEKLKANIL